MFYHDKRSNRLQSAKLIQTLDMGKTLGRKIKNGLYSQIKSTQVTHKYLKYYILKVFDVMSQANNYMMKRDKAGHSDPETSWSDF